MNAVGIKLIADKLTEQLKKLKAKGAPFYIFLSIPALIILTIHIEFTYKLSKHLPYYKNTYEHKHQIAQVKKYKGLVRKAINEWSIFHNHEKPTDANIVLIRTKLDEASQLQKKLETNHLNEEWLGFYLYYRTYSQFICADFNTFEKSIVKATQCLDEANESIRSLKQINQTTIEEKYLDSLELYIAAVNLELDPESRVARDKAERLFINYKNKSDLKLNDSPNDRLIKKVYQILEK